MVLLTFHPSQLNVVMTVGSKRSGSGITSGAPNRDREEEHLKLRTKFFRQIPKNLSVLHFTGGCDCSDKKMLVVKLYCYRLRGWEFLALAKKFCIWNYIPTTGYFNLAALGALKVPFLVLEWPPRRMSIIDT